MKTSIKIKSQSKEKASVKEVGYAKGGVVGMIKKKNQKKAVKGYKNAGYVKEEDEPVSTVVPTANARNGTKEKKNQAIKQGITDGLGGFGTSYYASQPAEKPGEDVYNTGMAAVSNVGPIGKVIGGVSALGDSIGKPIRKKAEKTDEYGIYKDNKKAERTAKVGGFFNPFKNLTETLSDKDASTGTKISAVMSGGALFDKKRYRAQQKRKQQEKAILLRNQAEVIKENEYERLENPGYAEGGKVIGPGTAKSDSIKANLKKDSFVVPTENAGIAKELRKKYLGGNSEKTANTKKGVPVKLSDGEHVFDPKEVAVLKSNGVNVAALAPNAEHSNKLKKGGKVDGPDDDLVKILQQLEADEKAVAKKKAQLKADEERQNQSDEEKSRAIAVRKKYESEQLKIANQKKEIIKKVETLKEFKEKGGNYGFKKYKVGDSADFIKDIKKDIKSYQQTKADSEKYNDPSNYEKDAISGYVFKPKLAEKKAVKTEPVKSSSIKAPAKPAAEKPLPTAEKPAVAPLVVNKSTTNVGDVVKSRLGIDMKAARELGLTDGSAKSNLALKQKIDKGEVTKANYKNINAPIVEGSQEASKDLTTKMDPNQSGREAIDQNLTGDPELNGATEIDENGEVVNNDNAPVSDGVKKAFQKTGNLVEKLGGPATVLSAGQAAAGLIGLLKQKSRPEYKIDGDVIADVEQAKDEATYGFSTAEKAFIETDIEMTRRMENKNILNLSGGNAGIALANMRSAGNSANRAKLQLASQDAALKRSKRQFSSALVNQLENRRRMKFEDNLTKFKENQNANAELLNAGLSNVFGSMERKRTLDRMDEIDKNSNLTFNF